MGCGSVFRKIWLLLCKNFLLRRRRYIITSLEIILPVILIVFLIYLESTGKAFSTKREEGDIEEKEEERFESISLEDVCRESELFFYAGGKHYNQLGYFFHFNPFCMKHRPHDPPLFLLYAPQNNITKWVVEELGKSMGIWDEHILGFDHEDDVLAMIAANYLTTQVEEAEPDEHVAIIFESGVDILSNYPRDHKIAYKIRMKSEHLEENLFSLQTFQLPGPGLHFDKYISSGFIDIQVALDKLLIRLMTKELPPVVYRMQPFPYPSYKEVSVKYEIIYFHLLPIFVVLGFIFMVPSIILNVVSEKQTGIKELMKMMGLPNYLHWITWMLSSMFVQIITASIVVGLLCAPINGHAIISNSSPAVWWCGLVLYLTAAIAFCFLIASFFQTPLIGMIVGLISWVLCYFTVAVPLSLAYDSTSFGGKIAMTLLPNAALNLLFRTMNVLEASDGAKWTNIAQPMSNSDHLTVLYIWLMLIADTFLYTFLAVYFDNILPSKYGIRKPVYYLFLPSTWVSFRQTKIEPNDRDARFEESDAIEPNDPSSKPGITIENLSKRFGRNKVAVDGISLTINMGQITCLLGHNGAGKTTTMSMLTGMFAPSSGTALVNGYNIRNQMDYIRKDLGLCPQENMLFQNLTVQEHLQFFGRLKGLSSKQAKSEAAALLEQLKMSDKKKSRTSDLSGGQKRRLALGIALVGGTKVVILDEPTSGMDPQARRAMWNILGAMRGSRTILLTTHYMEEADVLGDRIAIMANGRIMCCGTPNFLKRYYGAGYTLRITVQPEASKESILSHIQKTSPAASWKPEKFFRKSHISITLPSDAETTKEFPILFTDIDDNRQTLGILHVGLSVTTMDDVFLKVGELADDERQTADLRVRPSKSKTNSAATRGGKPKRTGTDIENASPSKPTVKSSVNDPMVEQNVANKAADSTKEDQQISTEETSVINNPEEVERIDDTTVLTPVKHKEALTSGCFFCQFWGLLVKRVYYSLRKWSLLICEFVIPILLIIGMIFLINAINGRSGSESKSFKLGLDDYPNAVTLFSSEGAGLIYGQAYESYASATRVSGDVVESLMKVGKNSLAEYRQNYIAAAKFKHVRQGDHQNGERDIEATALFSTVITHANPISINLLSNAILRSAPGKKDFSIEATNHPLIDELKSIELASSDSNPIKEEEKIIIVVFLGLSFSIFSASFVVFPIEETNCKCKQLQLMTGVSPIVFWGTSLLWDMVITFVLSLLILAAFFLLEYNSMYTAHNGAFTIVGTVLAFGWSACLFAYVWSNFFNSSSAGFATATCVHIFAGMFLGVISILVPTHTPTLMFRAVGRFFPTYGVTICFERLNKLATYNSKCSTMSKRILEDICSATHNAMDFEGLLGILSCCDECGSMDGVTCFKAKSYLEWEYFQEHDQDGSGFQNIQNSRTTQTSKELQPLEERPFPGLGQDLFYLFLVGFLYLLLLLLIEYRVFKRIKAHFRKQEMSMFLQPTDQDVLDEIVRIRNILATGDVKEAGFVVDGLCKSFGAFAAVSNVSFGVHPTECFGLLGVNGAGKTTTFGMLTGDIIVSSGNAYGGSASLKMKRNDYLRNIGYCPQFDGIMGNLTGSEMLVLFARLRGVKNPTAEAKKWLDKMGLTKSGNVRCMNYSGGMKRRLSAGMALIGDPPIILLDEPTSGVDPVSRRSFWEVVSEVTRAGQAVVLTSHSMDECEALCSRLGIMVNGQLQCFGEVQHLKRKFTMGFSIFVKFKPSLSLDSPQLETLNGEILQKFPQSKLTEQYLNVVNYHVDDTEIPWSATFQAMEDIKARYADVMEDYHVNETTLEEVFMSFALKQYADRVITNKKRCCCC